MGDGYSLEHLTVRCCKERMLRHVDSNSNNMYILHCMSWIKRKAFHYKLDHYVGDCHCYFFFFFKSGKVLCPISRDVDNGTARIVGSLVVMKGDVGSIKSNMSSMLFYVPPALLLPILF